MSRVESRLRPAGEGSGARVRDVRPRVVLLSDYRDAPRAVWRAYMVSLRVPPTSRRGRRAASVLARYGAPRG